MGGWVGGWVGGSDLVPRDKHSVMTAGSPSGMAATPSATATLVRWGMRGVCEREEEG